MGQGTKYTEKESLITAIIGFVFPNRRRAVYADNLQTSLRDIVESLWGMASSVVTLTITDDNVSTYYGKPASLNDNYLYLINIPDDVTHISIETTSTLSPIFGVSRVSTGVNGRRVTIVGNYNLGATNSVEGTVDGAFTKYLYNYSGGMEGSSGAFIPYASALQDTAFKAETFTEFMYWNGILFHRGY